MKRQTIIDEERERLEDERFGYAYDIKRQEDTVREKLAGVVKRLRTQADDIERALARDDQWKLDPRRANEAVHDVYGLQYNLGLDYIGQYIASWEVALSRRALAEKLTAPDATQPIPLTLQERMKIARDENVQILASSLLPKYAGRRIVDAHRAISEYDTSTITFIGRKTRTEVSEEVIDDIEGQLDYAGVER